MEDDWSLKRIEDLKKNNDQPSREKFMIDLRNKNKKN